MNNALPNTFKIITIWLLIGMVVFLAVLWFDHSKNKTKFIVVDGVIEIRQEADGHYYWQGEIEGHVINFLIDTGATTTSIPKHIATQTGLPLGPSVSVITANGRTRVATTTADLHLLGDIQIKNLRLTVSDSNPPQALLGMNVMSKLNWNQKNGVMRIHY